MSNRIETISLNPMKDHFEKSKPPIFLLEPPSYDFIAVEKWFESREEFA